MRILHVSSARTYGGGEKHLVELCRGLHEAGHEVFVALRPTNEWQHRLDFLPHGRILHVTLRNAFGMFSAKRIARFMRRNSIRVIHAHLARDYVPAAMAARLSDGAAFVLTRHVLFPMKPFHRFTLRNLSAAIAVSDAAAATLRDVIPYEKIRVIHNGVDLRDDSRRSISGLRSEFRQIHSVPPSVPLIGIIGELTLNKGQSVFLNAAQAVLASHPESRFMIVGRDHSPDGSEFMRLRELASELGLEDRLVFIEWVEDTEALFAALDVVVSASFSESFGLAVLEAMAEGCAIVSTATDGSKELLDDGTCGLLAPIGDPDAISEAVIRLLSNNVLAGQLGAKATDRATKLYSRKKMVDLTIGTYREIYPS